ncbi:MAG: hypothetical protein OEX02_18670 [Cyclobacteriaceae bacterium]|nr:hypothetical protein [Cyclobacteriaceae bacterium]
MKIIGTLLVVMIIGILLSMKSNVPNCEELTEEEAQLVYSEIKKVMDDYSTLADNPITQAIEMRADVPGYTKANGGVILDTIYSNVKEQLYTMEERGYKYIFRELNNKRIFVLSRTSAVCTFLAKEKMITPKGDTISYGGNWTFVFKKFNNSWKAVHEAGSIK